ncbi:MAG TPA: hypothetical protein VHE30_14550 [Polyangiaceae bacterium]|nr:hypothetical protein [Polyangiaceae bacterium]
MRHVLAFGVTALLAVACGGTSTIGKGGGNQNNGETGGSGNAGGDTGGRGGDPTGGSGGSTAGSGGSGTGVQCTAATDCISPGTCRACPDGSQVCDKVECVNGQCVMLDVYQLCPGTGGCDPGQCPSYYDGTGCCLADGSGCGLDYGKGCMPGPSKCDPATCPAGPNEKPCCLPDGFSCGVETSAGCGSAGTECKVDLDCPVPPPFCQLCDDGSCAPAFTRCTAGKCESGLGECPGQRHWYETCGDPVCSAPPKPSGARPCDPAKGEKAAAPCAAANDVCDPGTGCGVLLQCELGPTPCPK